MSKEKIFYSEDAFIEYCEENEDRTIVVYEDDVFDVTNFLRDHPGGSSIIEDYNNNDITELFHSSYPHAHSKTALRLLYKYKIGCIKEDGEAIVVEPEPVWTYPRVTETKIEYKEFQIDRKESWTAQITSLNKKQYLHILENPIELPSYQVFKNSFLDLLATSAWYYVPFLCIATILYIVFRIELIEAPKALLAVFLGGFMWTLIEYILYRFVFRADDHLIDNKWIFLLHFILYGKHQIVPSDHSKTAMPIGFGALLLWLFYTIFSVVFPENVGETIFIGFVLGYMYYEIMHYNLHSGTFKLQYMKEMQTYHNNQHTSKGNRGYGVTTKLWDKVFRTEIE